MKRRAGFTLIELVIVIMILGILAGVAAPKLFNTSATAKDNGLKQTLSIVRDAIELYAGKYGALPPCNGTGGSDFRTAVAEFMRGTFPTMPVGPVAIQDIDIESVASASPISATGSPTMGWKYSTTSGQFIVNYGAASSGGANYDTF
jgi:general secretion pathway protein G